MDDRNDVLLPIELQKEITSYLFYSLPLCMIMGYDYARPWFYENYIELFSGHTPIWFCMKYSDGYNSIDPQASGEIYKMLLINKYHSSVVQMVDDVVSLAEGMIDTGEYCQVKLDEMDFGKTEKPFPHEYLVYGYNRSKQVFYAIAFNKNQIFASQEIPYQLFSRSFRGVIRYLKERAGEVYDKTNIHSITCLQETLVSYRMMRYTASYSFSPEKVKNKLCNYLLSTTDEKSLYFNGHFPVPEEKLRVKGKYSYTYGLQTYDTLTQYLAAYDPEVSLRPTRADIHMFVQHKSNILTRMAYLCDYLGLMDKDITNEIQTYRTDVCKEANTFFNWYLKNRMLDGPLYINDEMIKKLLSAKDYDERHVCNFLNYLEKKNVC